MLYSEAQMKVDNLLSLLENMNVIHHDEISITPSSIPLLEFADPNLEGIFFAKYSDLENLSIEKEYSIHEAYNEVLNSHLLNRDSLVVAMEEWRPLINPNLIDEFENVVLIKEQGPTSKAYMLCETCLNPYIETRDPFYLNLYLEAIGCELLTDILLSEAKKPFDGWRGDLASMQAARDKVNIAYKKAELDANNVSLTPEQRAKAQNDMKALSQSLNDFDHAISARQGEQARRKEAQQGAIALNRKRGREADHYESATKEQQKAKLDAAKEKGFVPQNQPNSTQPEQQGWWARNWAAFKNWMNNLGSSGDQKSTWFTNMINNVKSKLGMSVSTTPTSNTTTPQTSGTTNNTASTTSTTNATTNSTNSNSGGTMAQQVANQVVEKGADKANEFIDNAKGKLDDIIQNATGMDASAFTQIAADQAKSFVDDKKQQVADKGAEMVQKGADAAKQVASNVADKTKETVKKATS